MKTIVLQGHDRHGWDTESVSSMDDVHAYLRHPHSGEITAYIDGKPHRVPQKVGKRYRSAKDDALVAELEARGFRRSGNSIVDDKGSPLAACLMCGKVYNDRMTRVSVYGPHCPYCGSVYTRELDWSTSAAWLAEAIAAGSPQLGRLSR